MGSANQSINRRTPWGAGRSVYIMMASIRILLNFAVSLVMVGCLPHYYNNRHRHSDYHSNYHYSYIKEPSYSQPTGRWVRLVECIGPRTFCTFPVGSREQATCVEVEEECWEGGYTWKEEDVEDSEEVIEKEVEEMLEEGLQIEVDLVDVKDVLEPDMETIEEDVEEEELEEEEDVDNIQQGIEEAEQEVIEMTDDVLEEIEEAGQGETIEDEQYELEAEAEEEGAIEEQEVEEEMENELQDGLRQDKTFVQDTEEAAKVDEVVASTEEDVAGPEISTPGMTTLATPDVIATTTVLPDATTMPEIDQFVEVKVVVVEDVDEKRNTQAPTEQVVPTSDSETVTSTSMATTLIAETSPSPDLIETVTATSQPEQRVEKMPEISSEDLDAAEETAENTRDVEESTTLPDTAMPTLSMVVEIASSPDIIETVTNLPITKASEPSVTTELSVVTAALTPQASPTTLSPDTIQEVIAAEATLPPTQDETVSPELSVTTSPDVETKPAIELTVEVAEVPLITEATTTVNQPTDSSEATTIKSIEDAGENPDKEELVQ